MTAPVPDDARRHAPATLRNRDAILAVLAPLLPRAGVALEIASGTGEHAAHFARALAPLVWQPTDADPEMRSSIRVWRAEADIATLSAPLALDVHDARWPIDAADAVVCINMIHIAPWSATPALVVGAAQLLPPGGLLFLYGPFRRDGAHTAPSNAEFDLSLRARDPTWGVRDLELVAAEAAAHGFGPPEVTPMPANNLSVAFRRAI